MTTPTPTYQFTSGAWADATRFVGREDLLADARACLYSSDRFDGRRFVARRRQGKTSLLHAIEQLARAGNSPSGGKSSDGDVVAAFVDLRAYRSEAEVASAIARAFLRIAPQRRLGAGLADQPSPLTALLRSLGDLAAEHPFRLVLLLDEAEALAPVEEELATTPGLRSLVGAVVRALHAWVDVSDFPLRMFITSTRRLDLAAGVDLLEFLQPFPVAWLGNLDERTVDTMLDRVGLSSDAVASLRANCGGHPYLLHVAGYALQRPGIDAASQIRLCMAHDFQHVLPEEAIWMSALAMDEQRPPPAQVRMLEQLSYVRRVPGGYTLVEGHLRAWLRALAGAEGDVNAAGRLSTLPRSQPPPEPVREITEAALAATSASTSATTKPRDPAAGPVAGMTLVRAPQPSQALFGELRVPGREPMNLGIQSYVLLYLVAANHAATDQVVLRGEEIVYPLRLALALCGCRHGFLVPKARFSDLRSAVESIPTTTGEPQRNWLMGRSGYHLHEDIQVGRVDDPLGHLGTRRVHLLDAYRRWEGGRKALLDFLRAARLDPRGVGAQLELSWAPSRLFPEHPAALFVRVRVVGGGSIRTRLGPIPLTEGELAALRYQAYCHEEQEPLTASGFGTWCRTEARALSEIPRVTAFASLLEELRLRGGRIEHGDREYSSVWVADPNDNRASEAAPDWLDLVFDAQESPFEDLLVEGETA